MTIEEQFKSLILEKFKSVRAFTRAIEVPYSTIDSMLKKGVSGTGIGTMIKVCNALNVDIESIEAGVLAQKKTSGHYVEHPEAQKIDGIYTALVNSLSVVGAIQAGEDITEKQAEVLISMAGIIKAAFYN